MKKKLVISFNKKIQEELLVDLISSILKYLYKNRRNFFLDDVLIDKNKYYFVFSGNENDKILIENINRYVDIQDYSYYVQDQKELKEEPGLD